MAKAREIEGLDCGAGAGVGIRLVLATRLEEMFGFRAAALDFTSPDGVHDMRVASRRLRSAVRAFVPRVRGGKRLEEAREELRRLADVLGEVRDADVALRALEKLEEKAPEEARAGLKLLADERKARREAARAELVSALDQKEVEEARSSILDAFERATAPRKGKAAKAGEGSDESFREVGQGVIGRALEELREQAPDLYRPLASKRLHDLRIAAKRLRYALELFDPCFGGALKDAAHRLADLQTALGDLHDCDEWSKEAGKYLRAGGDAPAPGDAGESRRDAALWLLEHFALKRVGHYVEALALWRGWEREGLEGRVASALGGD